MDVTALDRSAVLGDSLLHRAAPTTKLVAAGMLIAATITTADPLVTGGIALSLIGVATLLRLPLKTVLALALYAGIFAAVFAFGAAPGPVTATLFVLKAISSALVVVTLMMTTPYPQVFAPLQRALPTVVGDALLMTYRSLFLLAEKFSDLLRAVRLRAGLRARQPVRSAQATTRALGGLLLYSLDLAQREYDILRLRGYERGFRVASRSGADGTAGTATLMYAVVVLGAALAFRLVPELRGYSWLVTLGGSIDLLTGLAVGRRTR
jgi:energy-coupling factor transporter transmembrane protein EcfT